MTKEDTYNGWSNRETWAVALHIDNDQGMQEMVWEYAKGKESHEIEPYIRDIVEDIFRNVFDGSTNEHAARMVEDIGSLWRVDWREVAKHYEATNDD